MIPQTITVKLANGGRTSAGVHEPGDVQELPWEEGQALIRAGLAVRAYEDQPPWEVAEGR